MFSRATLAMEVSSPVGCGAFESDDFGVDWFPIGRGLPADCSVTTLDLDPDRTGTLFASGISGLFRSDYGSDWRQIDHGLFRGPVSLAVIGAWEHPYTFTPILFAAPEDGGFFISDDGGSGWSSANGPPSGIRIRALAFDQGNGGAILAGTDQGLYQTVDGGNTWTNADSSTTGMNVQSLSGVSGVIYLATGAGISRRYYPSSNPFSAGLPAGMGYLEEGADLTRPGGRLLCFGRGWSRNLRYHHGCLRFTSNKIVRLSSSVGSLHLRCRSILNSRPACRLS